MTFFVQDGDGTVRTSELVHAAELYRAEKKQTALLMKISIALFVIVFTMIGLIVGLTAVVVEESKETKVKGDVLKIKGSDNTVATAAVEGSFDVYDAVTMAPSKLTKVSTMMLVAQGGTSVYSITGLRSLPDEVVFNTAVGDRIHVTAARVIVRDSAGTTTLVMSKAARRRSLLGDNVDGAIVVTESVNDEGADVASGVYATADAVNSDTRAGHGESCATNACVDGHYCFIPECMYTSANTNGTAFGGSPECVPTCQPNNWWVDSGRI